MARLSASALEGVGFPAERLAQVSKLCGLPVASVGRERKPGASVLVVLGENWENQLEASLRAPCSGLIEAASLPNQTIAGLVIRARASEFYASFTSHAVRAHHLAGDVICALSTVRPLSEEMRGAVELALHEAICNALLHGNLHMKGFEGMTLTALENFSESFAQRMADPGLANRRIDIVCYFDAQGLTIDVEDEGCGFDPKLRNESEACGRGFTLIAAFCESYQLLDNGRMIRMRFRA